MLRNTLAVVGSVLFTVAVLEWTFPYWFTHLVPARIAMTMPDVAVRPLLQSSKSHYIPEQYIALLGDSYAEGAGDWAASAMQYPAARYHSAHLLQDATGMDVISFGVSGAGSVRGIVTRPVGMLAYIRHYLAPDMPDPAIALVYFYEGNDLNENVNYHKSSFHYFYPEGSAFSEATYRAYLEAFAVQKNVSYYLASQDRWLRHFPLLHLVNTEFRRLVGWPRESTAVPDIPANLGKTWMPPVPTPVYPGSVNHVLLGGQQVTLPDLLQGPPMELTDSEEQLAWFAFEQSVQMMRQKMPGTRVVLVYVPSVLMCYHLLGDVVSRQPYDRPLGEYGRSDLQARHDAMVSRLTRFGAAHGIPVIDTTASLRQASQQAVLHGPGDWNHFNRHGYEAFTAAIVVALAPLLAAWEEQWQ